MFENGSYCKASVCVVGLRHTMKISITPINRNQHSADLGLSCNKITHNLSIYLLYVLVLSIEY
jgi:hypothetical protein